MARGGLRAAGAIAVAAALLWVGLWLAPLPARLTAAPSPVVAWRDGTVAHVALAPDDRWRLAAELDRVDPDYVEALVRLEDKRFWWHNGVDPLAVARALAVNLWSGQVETGASTLTLQLVRVLEPRPRTWRSKLIEAARATTLELRMSKREILSAYLTFAPYGANVEGVRAAAFAYFGHDADALSAEEIAVLLAVPQRPTARAPSSRNAERLRAGRDGVARRLAALGALPVPTDGTAAATLTEILAAEVPRAAARFPREIPHLAGWLAERDGAAGLRVTTLDRGIQGLAERALGAAADDLAARGIRNATVVVVDHTTAEVVAVVGGFSFWDDADGAQIAAFDNPRSPGSTLKPFLYAMAIDRGVALPEHLVPDVPRAYGTYTPENFDGGFDGLVPLEESLSRSLNLPFVHLLEQLGVEPFLGLLRAAGADHLVAEPGWYGLSVAAGGIELTPLEVAGLYTALANGGGYRDLRFGADDPPARPLSIVSPGAAWLTRRALQLKDRPDFPTRWQVSASPRGIAWKTGTSFGHRDAWAAGWSDRYTAVVWLGNLDNRPAVDLVGAATAGPILFDILDALTDPDAAPTERPADLVAVTVCAYSGRQPGPACPSTQTAWATQGHVPTERCPYHIQRDIDAQTGLAVTPACRAGRPSAPQTFVVWPPSVRRFLTDRHHTLPEPPAWAPGCGPPGATGELAIVSPAEGQVAVVIPGLPADQQELPFFADATRPDARLTWFVDGEAIGRSRPDERVWWIPKVGRHEVVVVDERGALARRWLEVRDRPH